MSKQILVNASHYETRVATLEDGEIRQLHIEREEDRNVVGNIYKGVVKRVLPGMQAAFLELGLERTAFLYVDDIIDEPFGTDVDFVDEEDGEGDSSLSEEDKRELEELKQLKTGEDEEEGAGESGALIMPDEESEDSDEQGESNNNDEGDRPAQEQSQGSRGNDRPEREPYRRPSRPPRGRGGDRGRGRGGRGGGRRGRGTVNIQDLLKEGQEILVQVAKAPIGTKGARLTTHISLPGRNLVLMPTVKHVGISRRIENERERRRLRELFLRQIRPREVGFIIRTVAEGKSFRDLVADADYLMKLWGRIKKDSKSKRAPALIHEDLSLAMRSVRDFFTDEVDSFVIDDSEEHDKVMSFITQFMPRLKGRVKLFKGPSQLFEHFGIEAEISRALGKKVWLKSGGYLLIDQSEALTAIDVNTGRYVGSKSLEETILKTNLEAVKEIAYQLRIRNVGGIIIIDLIDMESHENRDKVFRALQEALGEDKAKTNILKISDLGLVEMTRKRTHEDLIRYLTEACHYCEGRGYHKSKRTVCFEIFREIEKESLSALKNIVVYANPQVVHQLTHSEKPHVDKLETRFQKGITIKSDPGFHVEQFEVFGRN